MASANVRKADSKIKMRAAKVNDNLAYYTHIVTYIYLVAVAINIMFFLQRGDDFAFHIQRLQAISDSIRGGQSSDVQFHSRILWLRF